MRQSPRIFSRPVRADACRSAWIFFALLAVSFSSACDTNHPDAQKAAQELEVQVDRLGKTVSEYVGQMEAPAELKKLQQYEYRVLGLPAETLPDTLAAELNKLGAERWECFHIEKILRGDKEELTLFLKRRPDTPLKYVPKTILGS